MAASRGGIGGAADDAGTEYKRGVAAFAVAYGLAGAKLPLNCFPNDERQVAAVDAETDDPVDDVRVTLASGRVAFIQAKHTLKKGRPLNEAVAQWVVAARAGLDRDTDRLVIASENLSGPMKDLGAALDRRRSGRFADATDAEQRAATALDALLEDLTVSQKEDVWACGAVWHLQVREESSVHTQNAVAQLRHIVSANNDVTAHHAWTQLLGLAGRASRMRNGYEISQWAGLLAGTAVPLSTDGTTPSARAARRHEAISAYLGEVTYRGTHVRLQALGATLPDLPLADSDVELEVAFEPDNDRDTAELRWGFLTRHRAVLTGLPGAGKSTVLRQLAAQFAEDPEMPFPVYASLRNFDPNTGLLKHLLADATSIVRDDHAEQIALEVRERIASDRPLVLLLDSLDETYDRRFDVVGAISALVRQLPEGVAILLATRDVGHADARTLGWHDLRLLPPKSLDRPVRGILALAATTENVPDGSRERWISERADWVARVLTADSVLAETPLFGTLLALLASTAKAESLPTSRGAILSDVVREFILKRELDKRAELLDLKRDEAQELGLQAFATEAHALLDSRSTATEGAVVAAIAKRLRAEWELPPARSTLVARRIVHVFDEAGVFVIDSSGTISPRISLLAEVGDAMMAIDGLDIEGWLAQRIAAEQYEPLVLAFTLSAETVQIAVEVLKSSGSYALADSLASAVAHGASLDDDATRLVASRLISHVAEGTSEGWMSWRSMRSLALDATEVSSLLAASAALPIGYQHIIRSEAHLLWGSSRTDDEVLELMRATLWTNGLPLLKGQVLPTRMWEAGLADAQARAAEHMLALDPATASELAERFDGHASFAFHERLWTLLVEFGDVEAIEKARETRAALTDGITLPSWDYDVNNWIRLLDILSEEPAAPLTTRQRIATPDLSLLFSLLTLRLAGSVQFVNADPAVIAEVFAMTARLFSIDRGHLSAEAAIVRSRVDRWGTNPLFAATDTPEPKTLPRWDLVDAKQTAGLLSQLLHFPDPQAHFAAWALANGPSDVVVDLLSTAMADFEKLPHRQHLIARAFAHASATWTPSEWAEHPNPVLREVAVSALSPDDPLFRKMVHEDPDRYVQSAAVERLLEEPPPDVLAVLDKVVHQDPAGWTCRHCRTVNSPSESSCSGKGCMFAPPNPRDDARTAAILLG